MNHRKRSAGRSAALLGALLVLGLSTPRQLPAQSAPSAGTCRLEEATVAELQQAMRSGGCTSRALVEGYLRRIETLDRQGPRLRSVIELNPDALAVADSMDRERRAGRVRGPLHGIPVLIKDNIDTADRMTTTAGALALEGSIAPRDAFIVERLRAEGAVLLGKTNLSEWANFRAGQSSSGWSGRGGQTRNPYVLDRSPCGSSSGTGAAIAASLAVVGVGTETNGSIVCPSSVNGLVGIKPTVGLLSRSGIIPISHSQDTPGPMARTVADAAVLLGAMAGVDPRDPATAGSDARRAADYTRYLDPNGLRGARIGVARSFFGRSPEADRIMEAAIEELRRAGAVIVDSVSLGNAREYGGPSYTVLLYEFKHGVDQYLASLGPDAPVKSLQEVIDFNERNRERSMPFFGQDILVAAQAKGPLTDEEYLDALETSRRLARAAIDDALREHRLDAIIAPTGSPAWTIDVVNGDHFVVGSSSAAAIAGYASVTVPAGFAHELPVGISFIGGAWSEPTLLRLAYAFEQATRQRRAPRYLPSLDPSGF